MESETWDDGEEALESERTLEMHAPAIDDPSDAEYCAACGSPWPCPVFTQQGHACEPQ